MRQLLAVAAMILAMVSSAWAVQGNEVALSGSSVAGIPVGTVGTLDLGSSTAMVFRAAGKEIAIPYAGLSQVQSRTEVARHLGVLPAIGVALVRKRERKHFITLTFEDSEQKKQAVIFEVPKTRPAEILAIIQARAPSACGKTGLDCRVREEE